MQAVENFQFSDMISFADALESLHEFFKVQEAVAICIHQPECTLDLEFVFVVVKLFSLTNSKSLL